MTTNASDSEIDIEYETAVPTAGGPDAADFRHFAARPTRRWSAPSIWHWTPNRPSKPSADRSPKLKCRR